jgi:hypothetical protein
MHVQHEPAPRIVPVEQLRIAAPVDGRFQLPRAFVFAELLVQHVQEKLLRNGMIALVRQRPGDLPQQQYVIQCCFAEQFLLLQNLRLGKRAPFRRDRRVAFLYFQKTE